MAQFQKPTATLCRRYFTTDEAEALKGGIFVFQTNRLFISSCNNTFLHNSVIWKNLCYEDV